MRTKNNKKKLKKINKTYKYIRQFYGTKGTIAKYVRISFLYNLLSIVNCNQLKTESVFIFIL